MAARKYASSQVQQRPTTQAALRTILATGVSLFWLSTTAGIVRVSSHPYGKIASNFTQEQVMRPAQNKESLQQ